MEELDAIVRAEALLASELEAANMKAMELREVKGSALLTAENDLQTKMI